MWDRPLLPTFCFCLDLLVIIHVITVLVVIRLLQEGGDVWERLLLAARCSFLALSATIGNPEEFAAWLRRVKRLQREQVGGVRQRV